MAMTVGAPTMQASGILLYQVGWAGYQSLLEIVGKRPVRLTYDRGDVEFLAPHPILEIYKRLIGYAINLTCEEFEIPMIAMGSTTFRREDLDRGLDPDLSYDFSSAAWIRDRIHINLEEDPPPDLAIEIEISRRVINRLAIYAALGVSEIWRFDGKELSVLSLDDDRRYTARESSSFLPQLPMKRLAQFVREYDLSNDTRWARTFRAWLREDVVPRFLADS